MKKAGYRICGTLLAVVLAAAAAAQQPEKVYSIVKEIRPAAWYEGQVRAWDRVIRKQPRNADAWLNFYTASRMVHLYAENNPVTVKPSGRFLALNRIVQDMGRHVPGSFEYNLVMWNNNGYGDTSFFSYLEKAYRMAPDRPETYPALVAHYERQRAGGKRDEVLVRWFRSGDPIPALLNYNYNVLASVAENGILITAGDNDTYPVWILQAASGIRKDVTVLNLNMLMDHEYRSRIFPELGIPEWSGDTEQDAEVRRTFVTEMVAHIARNAAGRLVHIAVTAASGQLTEAVKDQLYLTGLAYCYSPEKLDNIALLRRKFEQEFALDYLFNTFRYERFSGVAELVNGNYVVPALHLYEHYRQSGDNAGAERMRTIALRAAAGAGMAEQADTYFRNAAKP